MSAVSCVGRFPRHGPEKTTTHKLRPVGVRPGVGHGQHPGPRVTQSEVLVGEARAVYGPATRALRDFGGIDLGVGEGGRGGRAREIATRARSGSSLSLFLAAPPFPKHRIFDSTCIVGCKITPLAHKRGDNAMEAAGFKALPRGVLGERRKVFCCGRCDILLDLHDDAPQRGGVAIPPQRDVEVDERVGRVGGAWVGLRGWRARPASARGRGAAAASGGGSRLARPAPHKDRLRPQTHRAGARTSSASWRSRRPSPSGWSLRCPLCACVCGGGGGGGREKERFGLSLFARGCARADLETERHTRTTEM